MKDLKIFKKLSNNRGKQGEDIAVRFLKNKGYKVIERNFRTRSGEIDIIAKDKDFYVFVEVKFRKNQDFGQPYEFVNKNKKIRMIRAIKYYLLKKDLNNINFRIDIISIIEKPELKIEHFLNVIEEF